jgi:hypothetical protein
MAIGMGLIRLKTEEKREEEQNKPKKRSTGKKGHKRRPVEQDKQLIKRTNKGQQSEWGTKAQRINKKCSGSTAGWGTFPSSSGSMFTTKATTDYNYSP